MKKALKELIVYIASESEDDSHFGVTKLNKILFAIDFNAYGLLGQSLTGSKYIHMSRGPVPNKINKVIGKLAENGDINIHETTCYGYPLHQIIANRPANMSMFENDEMQIIDDIIETVRGHTATKLSEWTHSLMPWILTDDYEEIPYDSVFVWQDYKVERAALKWAQGEVKEYCDEYCDEMGYA